MKMIFVGNENLATALKESLSVYFPDNHISAVDFCYPDHKEGTRRLAQVLLDALNDNPDENFVILADTFESTACTETRLLLTRSTLDKRSVLITGMNLPLAIKYYGLKDIVPVGYLQSLQKDEPFERIAG